MSDYVDFGPQISSKALPVIERLKLQSGAELSPKSLAYAVLCGERGLIEAALKRRRKPVDLDAQLWPPSKTSAQVHYNLLQWAVYIHDLDCAAFLVERGANPNAYNSGVTAVGMAGYTGQHDMLRIFRDAGADLRLTLSPELLSGGTADPQCGSTLLHRMLERPPTEGARSLDNAIETALFLAECYATDGGDPWPKTAAGRDPLANAVPLLREPLARWLAVRERAEIESAIDEPGRTPRRLSI